MQRVSRDDVKALMRDHQNLVLVDVLPPDAFADFHIPGAVNVPMGEGFDEAIQAAVPNKSDPVVVYCQDSDCDLSPKAAKRMEQLGYRYVHDYEGGKADWKEAGLPIA